MTHECEKLLGITKIRLERVRSRMWEVAHLDLLCCTVLEAFRGSIGNGQLDSHRPTDDEVESNAGVHGLGRWLSADQRRWLGDACRIPWSLRKRKEGGAECVRIKPNLRCAIGRSVEGKGGRIGCQSSCLGSQTLTSPRPAGSSSNECGARGRVTTPTRWKVVKLPPCPYKYLSDVK